MQTNVGIVWCGGYEIHYTSEPDRQVSAQGAAVVYFPIRREAFASTFVPTPGLADRNSPDFDPSARSVRERNSHDRFAISPAGVRLNNPDITGIVERLLANNGFKHVFQPTELPTHRWDNLRLTSVPLSSGLVDHCEALRCEYGNGFVEARRYRIEEGDVENSVIAQKRYPTNPLQFMEMLRHPVIAGDFHVESADWECLISLTNWTYYSPFLFCGFLAQTLTYGGAYSSRPVTEEVRSKALRLADEVFAGFGRYERGLELYVCSKPWCSLFADIAWDHTWIVFETAIRTFTILLATDTD